jgi:hypothetical protein
MRCERPAAHPELYGGGRAGEAIVAALEDFAASGGAV